MVKTKDGGKPFNVITAYDTYTAEGGNTAVDNSYLHTMLMPDEEFSPPIRSVISTEDAVTQFDGTAVDTTEPTVSLAIDTGVTLGADLENTETQVTTSANGTNYFRVGDLIQVGVNETTTKRIEIMRVTSIDSTTVMQVQRALYGTTIADKDDQTHAASGAVNGARIYFPNYNTYHRYDQFSTQQTDGLGRYAIQNLYNLGRSTTATNNVGIVPGSFSIKFYNSGYQSIGVTDLRPSSESGLTAGQEYRLNIKVDGGTVFEDLTFTIDSSNTRFGGTNGVIEKIQQALDSKYYVAGNLFEKGVTVSIVNGDLRFTSQSRLSTSAIELANASGGTNFFGVGRIPTVPDTNTAVAAVLPDDTIQDPVTFASSPNNSVFMYDDGQGNLFGAGQGTINYETGAIDFTGPANANFAYAVTHSSAFSGKLNEGVAGRANTLKEVIVNTPSQKWNGTVGIKVFK